MPRLAPCLHALCIAALWGSLIAVAASMAGCAAKKPPPAAPAVVFPPPPVKPRVQFLGSISSQADLPRQTSGLAEFVLGPPTSQYPLAKPIVATMRGTRLFICDTVFNSVLVYDLDSGDTHPLKGDRGVGKIQQPNSLDFDDEGRLYIADSLRQAVLVYGADESFERAIGHPGECKPVAVAVGAGDELFVCDRDGHEIEVWDRRDGTVLRRFGGLGKEPGKFLIPTALAVDDDGHLYVTDTGNFRVQKLTAAGEPLHVYGGLGRTLGRFAWPKGLDVDAHDHLFVADSRFANVQIFDEAGRLLLFFGGPGPDNGNLDLPAGVRVVPWPDVAWCRQHLMPGFDPESLAIVVNQQGSGFVNLFAVARDEGTAP